MRRWLGVIPASLAGLAAAAPASACSACFFGSEPGVRLGYYVSTAILSLTPLVILGLMGTYIGYKYSRHNRGRAPQANAN